MSEMKKRANSVYTYRLLNGVHEWHFDGQPVIMCDPDKASAQARHFLLNYGVKQWVNDGGAVEAGPDGKVDPQAKFKGIRARAELIESGVDDLLRRAASVAGEASYVTQALIRLGKAADRDEANAKVKALADKSYGGEVGKARAALAKDGRVVKAILDIKAEELAARKPAVDAGDLLADL